jgi:hypothetical protein
MFERVLICFFMALFYSSIMCCCFINFFIITQMKPKSTLKVINEIEIVTHNQQLSSAALKLFAFLLTAF